MTYTTNNKRCVKWRGAWTAVAALLAVLACGCDRFDGLQEVPAYLSVEGVRVVDDPQSSWSALYGEGFLATQAIDAVQLSLYFENDTSEVVLGTYQLPCKVPVLRQGTVKRLVVTPVVKQNGIAATRIAYPYYNAVTLNDIRLVPDSTTALGTVTTTVNRFTEVAWHEFFEKIQMDVSLDSCVGRVTDRPDLVRTGTGSGVIHVGSGTAEVNFWSDTTIHVADPTSYLYLEMDYRTDFNMSVGIKSPTIAGGAEQTNSAMMLYANESWQKIYINLGKVWRYHGHYPDIRLFFTVFNSDGKEGDVYLDNMKLLVI
ncbi:MAG: hypothetical protein J6X62_02695 [Bacteroidales bacterium]|nr:hypothetical protein [Bacteroidales bacterium]